MKTLELVHQFVGAQASEVTTVITQLILINMISAIKKEGTNWTDDNKRILIFLLLKYSDGDYSHILNDKKNGKLLKQVSHPPQASLNYCIHLILP